MQVLFRIKMWSDYSYEKNLTYDFLRECSTKRSLLEIVRIYFIKKEYKLLGDYSPVYWRLEIYIDGYLEVTTCLYKYRSLKRFRSFLSFYYEKALEYHDLPF